MAKGFYHTKSSFHFDLNALAIPILINLFFVSETNFNMQHKHAKLLVNLSKTYINNRL